MMETVNSTSKYNLDLLNFLAKFDKCLTLENISNYKYKVLIAMK